MFNSFLLLHRGREIVSLCVENWVNKKYENIGIDGFATRVYACVFVYACICMHMYAYACICIHSGLKPMILAEASAVTHNCERLHTTVSGYT